MMEYGPPTFVGRLLGISPLLFVGTMALCLMLHYDFNITKTFILAFVWLVLTAGIAYFDKVPDIDLW